MYRGFLLGIKGTETRNRPPPFRAEVRGASRLRPYTPSRHGALIFYESSVSSILCDVLIRTQLRGSKMFPYCSYVPVLLRCCPLDIDRSTRSVWDSVPQENRELQEFAKRATTQRPAVWQHSARTHALVTSQEVHTHSSELDGTYLSVINSVSGIELCEFAIFNRFDSLFIGRTSSFRGPGSVVGIATAYGLDGPGIESR